VPAPTVPRIATAPATTAWIDAAVVAGGGEVVAPDEAEAVVWTHPADPEGLAALLAEHPHLRWIQLPWAGIDAYRHLLDRDHVWSCAKGVYSDPVAEHALALLLAGFRNLGPYSVATTWSGQVGRNLLDARVTILGGGGIAQVLIGLLAPFRCHVTVVRRHPAPMDGVERVLGPDRLDEALADADAVVLALSLLPETVGIIGAEQLAAMADHAWLINVARGAHVDTDALVAALDAGTIGGAGLDVTDPEPLPDGHPLWARPNVIITPHTANTKAMARPLLSARITENVRRWARGEPLVGSIDVDLGY
jgi:phosphoglycerate dehydrogenase-like enzyme